MKQFRTSRAATTAYSAFGELVTAYSPLATRYRYAGGWGYESRDGSGAGPGLVLQGANGALAPITLLHVGERWYQPNTGRFIQRDPIGLRAGMNLYAYVASQPITQDDPSGLKMVVQVVIHNGQVLVHVYDEPGFFGRLFGKECKYRGTRAFPLNGTTPTNPAIKCCT